jgi:hypothetical protein
MRSSWPMWVAICSSAPMNSVTTGSTGSTTAWLEGSRWFTSSRYRKKVKRL